MNDGADWQQRQNQLEHQMWLDDELAQAEYRAWLDTMNDDKDLRSWDDTQPILAVENLRKHLKEATPHDASD